MTLQTRKLLDRYFSAIGVLSILLMVASVFVILLPMLYKGAGAFCFRSTIEHRRLMLEKFERGDRTVVEAEIERARAARAPVYEQIARFESALAAMAAKDRAKYRESLKDFKRQLAVLLGPAPGATKDLLTRNQYGQTRWERAELKLERVLNRETWDYSDPSRPGLKVMVPREQEFAGTSLVTVFPYIRDHVEAMLLPRRVFYWQFLTDDSIDSHMFGGIWPELLGTIYLTIGAILFAVPMGVIAAIYLTEYARETQGIELIRTCISTLAGVPSIVFGLFGLAFFINTMGVSDSKSVLAGSLTLALMILPTVIRASEEAIRAVPHTYKEAALSLGAGRWHTVLSVILPAALPGILTGVILSMGRAAGETAPIIFTAAVSVGKPLGLLDVFSQPTPALPWNIYNLATEHEAVDEIRHIQFGMVTTLVVIVLLLNVLAIILRARISRTLKV